MQSKINNILTVITAIVVMAGCGTTVDRRSAVNKDITPLTENIDKTSKSYFGTLADATVKIYLLGEGSKKLMYEEHTTTGKNSAEIGNFDTHSDVLDKAKFYLYEVSGGQNMDIDADGVLDSTPTANRYIYRKINRGRKNHVAWWRTSTGGESPHLSEM